MNIIKKTKNNVFIFIIISILSVICQVGSEAYYWNYTNVKAGYASECGFDLKSVTVAVIDSGVNYEHEDLDPLCFIKPHNFIDGSEDVHDDLGHGTNVIGTIASIADNDKGIDGLAYGVNIMPLKVLSSSNGATISRVVQAVDYALENGADVINMSMGLSKDTDSMRAALKNAADNGVIIVSAVGNDGTDTLAYPAAYDFVVGVGSVDENDLYSTYSRYNNAVWVTAPGERVVTLSTPDKNSYAYINGTSVAAPHVSSLAAIAKAYDKDIDVYDFLELLKNTSEDHGEAGYDKYYGYGIISFKSFIDAMTSYDVDLDGKVDTTDVLLIKKHLIGTFDPSDERTFNVLDADGDKMITVTDYIYFKRKILKLI